ncbi:MAG: flagellar hook protein FlgE [Alphaproteobacteria bacterium]|nr:flagellar hook protein FlgE [Alphaproteobacteria bacterium]
MSLLGAFIAGVTGIDGQSTKFGAISDNIANANTVGYKPTSVLFKTLVTRTDAPTSFGASGAIPRGDYPGGVVPVVEQRMDLQGILQASSSSTDLGIVGNGFFPVATAVNTTTGAVASGAQRAVTRAGSFHMDANGFMMNSAGYALMGSPAGGGLSSTLTGLVPVKFDPGPSVTIAGVATTQASIAGNLPASTAIGDVQNQTIGVFDATGTAYTLSLQFTKTALNTWSVVAKGMTPADTTSGVTVAISSTPMTLTFNADGTIASGGTGSLGTFTSSNGQSISPNFNFLGSSTFSATTQFGDQFAVSGVQQDGKASGSRLGFQVDKNGVMSEVYSNGLVLPKFQIPVVTYVNPQGLEAISGNAWVETNTSGTAAVNASNTGGAGQLTPSTLESSSTDLSEEFSQMIVSQSVYSANTKTITTANQMYELLTQLR